jgi:hypothetical protein
MVVFGPFWTLIVDKQHLFIIILSNYINFFNIN